MLKVAFFITVLFGTGIYAHTKFMTEKVSLLPSRMHASRFLSAPYPRGWRRCHLNSSMMEGCIHHMFVYETLKCSLHVILSRSTNNNQNHLCGHVECQGLNRCIYKRTRAPVCVQTPAKKKLFDVKTASSKEKKCVSPSSTSVSGQKVLIPLKKYHKFGTKTTLYSVDVADGKWRPFRQISGDVIHLAFSGPLMFHCQRSRDGLFMTRFKDGPWQNGIRMLNAVCYNVAGDHKENVVFFIWSRGLIKLNLTDRSTKNTQTGLEGKIAENRLSLDKQNRFVYFITLDNRIIRRVSYDGQHQSDILSSDTMRQLVFSPPNIVYYTSRSDRHVLRRAYVPPYDKGIHPMRGKSIASGMISTFDVLSDKIAVGYRRAVTFYCRSSLVELSTIDLQKYSQNILTDMYALEEF